MQSFLSERVKQYQEKPGTAGSVPDVPDQSVPEPGRVIVDPKNLIDELMHEYQCKIERLLDEQITARIPFPIMSDAKKLLQESGEGSGKVETAYLMFRLEHLQHKYAEKAQEKTDVQF